jgi:succinoglycan biosynthesis transport protein ExoP
LVQQSIRGNVVSAGPEAKDLSLADLWLIVRKRRFLVLSITFGLAILAGLAGWYRGNRYTASGEIQIQPNSSSDLKANITSMLSTGSTTLDEVMESDINILQSNKILLAVARSLQLQDNPEFLGGQRFIKVGSGRTQRLIPLLHGDLDDPYVQNRIVGALRTGLVVSRIPRTEMISIEWRSRSPQMAANVVNALEQAFVLNNFQSHYKTTEAVSTWLTGQIDDLRKVVQDSQDRMVALQRKLGVSALDPTHSMLVSQISNLDKAVSDATEQRVLAEARFHILASLPPQQILDGPSALGNEGQQSLLASLRTQRATAAASLAHMQPLYGPNYPEVKQLNAQIAAIDGEISQQESRVVEQAKASAQVAQIAENQARGMRDGEIQQVYGQGDDVVQYMLLSQDYESNRKIYEGILGSLREAEVDAGLDAADVSVVDVAALPIQPSSMSPMELGMIGLLFGAFGALTLSLILEKMDTRVRDAREIQELLGLPSLAMIPQSHWKSRESETDAGSGPELLRDPRSAFSESFRALRTSMRLSSTSRQSKVIAVTSCQPAEGKSTVSVNMAAVLAQGGKKVVLVDTDMRRPSVYKRLRMEGGKGLSELLTGYYTLEEVTQTHATLPTLDVIPSGTVPPLPADLLSSDQMVAVVRQLRERYDYVIFDTPPILSVTDPAIVAAQSDGMVLVIRQGYCTRRMLSHAAEIFRDLDVKVYGFVFNGVDASLPEYYGYLGYYTYEYGK